MRGTFLSTFFISTFSTISILLFALTLIISTSATLPAASANTGAIAALSVANDNDTIGEVVSITLETRPGHGAIYLESTPLTKIDTQMSARIANEAACELSTVDCSQYDFFYTIHIGSSVISGPSAGGAITVLTYAVLENLPIRNDTAMTGAILSGNIIGPVGGVSAKIRGAAARGYRMALVPAWESAENDLVRVVGEGNSTKTGDTRTIRTTITIPAANTSRTNATMNGTTNDTRVVLTVKAPQQPDTNDTAVETVEMTATPGVDGIIVRRVRSVADAIETFTGKRPPTPPPLQVPKTYSMSMLRVAQTLCDHARITRSTIDHESLTVNDTLALADAAVQEERAYNASTRGDYYTAASQCFGSALISQRVTLTHASNESRRTVLANVDRDAKAMREAIEKSEMKTISDLEVRMIAFDRLSDVERALLTVNRTNPDPSALAYMTERTETARAWYSIIGRIGGEDLLLTNESLLDSCLQKLSEAQDRVNYVSTLYPRAAEQLTESLTSAFTAAHRQHSGLCILQASQAKAEANAIISALYTPQDEYTKIEAAKRSAAANAIARTSAESHFPILSYSYYEYSGELESRDEATAALYTEYALELARLPIYFPPKHKANVRIDLPTTAVFFLGTLLGAAIGVAVTMFFEHRSRRTERKRHARESTHASPRKRRTS